MHLVAIDEKGVGQAALSSMDGGQVSLGWVSETQLNVLSFNEDLQTRPWWSPTPDMCLLTGALAQFFALIIPQRKLQIIAHMLPSSMHQGP